MKEDGPNTPAAPAVPPTGPTSRLPQSQAPPPITPVGGSVRPPVDRTGPPQPLRYPDRFPESFRPHVDRARDRAELQFRDQVKSAYPSVALAFQFMDPVFREFARQVVEASRQGHLNGAQIQEVVADSLPELAGHAYDLCKVRKIYNGNAPWQREDFKAFAVARIMDSELWRQHLRERLDAQATTPSVPQEADKTASSVDATPGPCASTDTAIVKCGEVLRDAENDRNTALVESASLEWADLTIRVLSDERVQVHLGDKSWTANYAEFGFEDRRDEKQNQAWGRLLELAQQSGVLPSPSPTGPSAGRALAHLQWDVGQIRRVLKRHFPMMNGDPLPFVDGKEYRAAFTIYCAPASDS